MRERGRIWSDDRGHLGGGTGQCFCQRHNEPCGSLPIVTDEAMLLTYTLQLFGFSPNAYYRDILVFCAFIGGLAVTVVFAVWIKVRERR